VDDELEQLLVTGANGHLGRRLIERVLREGLAGRVHAVVRSEHAASSLEPLARLGPLDVSILDPRRAGSLAPLLSESTHVVHLVGILKQGSEARYVDAHEKTASALVEAAAGSSVRRLAYLSILGAGADSANACLSSKGRAEDILLGSELESVVLRVPMVLGEGDFATRALAARARSSVLPMVRGGASLEQPIYAGDVVEAILRALVTPGLANQRLDLAGPETLAGRELARRAAAVLGRTPRVIGVPLLAARLLAGLAERVLVHPPLTRAMLGVLEHDDDIDPTPACRRLSIELTPLDVTLKRCLAEPPA